MDERNHQICSDILPEACWNRAYREIDQRGLIIRQVEAPLTPEQRTERDAEVRRKREQQRLAGEARRRDQALLDSYTSERDIETVRDRALGEIQKDLTRATDRYGQAELRRKKLAEEMQAYRDNPPPKELVEAIRDNESELRADASVIEAKKRELDATRTKFEEEQRRYGDLVRARSNPSGKN